MRCVKFILVAAMAISLAGCILRGKTKTAATPAPPAVQPLAPPPPEPLSIAQTQVLLPPKQDYDANKALKTIPPKQPPAQTGTTAGDPQKTKETSKPAGTGTNKPAEVTTTEPPAPEPSRPPIGEILPADEEKRLQESADAQRADAQRMVTAAEKRRLNVTERSSVAMIKHYLLQCKEAEENKDMRTADEFAHKAFLLARELQGGK